jgi:mRNA interferase RelE/StbE
VSYEIEWSAPALRELRKLDKPVARKVLTAVTRLSADPRPPGAQALIGQPKGTMRLRIGDYRVVYVIQDKSLVPLSGGPFRAENGVWLSADVVVL